MICLWWSLILEWRSLLDLQTAEKHEENERVVEILLFSTYHWQKTFNSWYTVRRSFWTDYLDSVYLSLSPNKLLFLKMCNLEHRKMSQNCRWLKFLVGLTHKGHNFTHCLGRSVRGYNETSSMIREMMHMKIKLLGKYYYKLFWNCHQEMYHNTISRTWLLFVAQHQTCDFLYCDIRLSYKRSQQFHTTTVWLLIQWNNEADNYL